MGKSSCPSERSGTVPDLAFLITHVFPTSKTMIAFCVWGICEAFAGSDSLRCTCRCHSSGMVHEAVIVIYCDDLIVTHSSERVSCLFNACNKMAAS